MGILLERGKAFLYRETFLFASLNTQIQLA